MKARHFTLRPFAPPALGLDFDLGGELCRRDEALALRYELCGPLAGVALPAPAALPARRDRLWEETCFELFLGVRGAPIYWEFNLSPAGHWNVYRFNGCRQGMAEERAFASLTFSVLRRPESLALTLEVNLGRIIQGDQPLEAAVTAVVRLKDGRVSYWALSHIGPQPDFHRRDGFQLTF